MPKRNAKSDHMQRKSPTWIARVMEERMENVSGCCRSLAHHRKPSGNAMWCRTCRSEIGADIVWLGGVSNVAHQRHPGHDDQYPLVCIDYGYLSGDATPIMVAKYRRAGMVFALSVEREGAADPQAVEKLAEWVNVLGWTQVTVRSDGEPAVMQVAAAVRDARRAGSVTTLETSAPGDHAGNGLAERAVGLVGGMVRTLKNELEFNCQMLIPPKSKTIAWMIVHATTLLNLDTVGSMGKYHSNGGEVADTTWADACSEKECGIEWVH